MQPYKNLNGNSGIRAFEIGKDFISVQFKNRTVYKYSYLKPGKDKVKKMIDLAHKGQGLSTFISQEVQKSYESKTE